MEKNFENMTFDEIVDKMFSEWHDTMLSRLKNIDKANMNVNYVYKDKNDGKQCERAGSECVESLKSKIAERDSRINSLKKEMKALEERVTKSGDMYNNVAKESSAKDSVIIDKVEADGYKIVNDIKVWIEFARKCGAFYNDRFINMADAVAHAINDFIMVRKGAKL